MKEKGQYFIAFGVIAAMLMVAGFPTFIVFFFGIFAFFLWRTFASTSRSETREIFEFYLSANDILRDEERRWYGFELSDVIGRGERVVRSMSAAPPLVYFALGALYQKAGDHQSAVKHLSFLVENESSDEINYAYPSPDLKKYVSVLRKIEREPHESPMTAASIRALERSRRMRGKTMLELSRDELAQKQKKYDSLPEQEKRNRLESTEKNEQTFVKQSLWAEEFDFQPDTEKIGFSEKKFPSIPNSGKSPENSENPAEEANHDQRNRKSISEVLHDIYDNNVQ